MKQTFLRIVLAGLSIGSLANLVAADAANPATGHTYVYHSGPITFQDAEAWAASLGGHLVTVNDAAEQAWLNVNFPMQYWIGLNDAANEGVWVWTSGEPVTYTHWWPDDSQPDGSGDYGWSGYGAFGWWDDHSANGNGWGAVAELPWLSMFVATVSPPSTFSPDPETLNANLDLDPTVSRIDSFKCGSLTPYLGLSIELGDGSAPSFEDGPGSADEAWDFDDGLWNHGLKGITDVTFEVPGTTEFGVGISHLEQETSVSVNGIVVVPDIRDLPNFSPGGPNSKNGYLHIRVTGDELIRSVTFHSVPAGSSDSILFDHVSWNQNPLPADFNHDGTVDAADLSVLLGMWGITYL